MCRAERQAVFEAAVCVLQELKQAVFERNAFRLAGPKSRLFHFSGAALRFYKERLGAYLNLSA
ncbi:MAG: hypothetical protein ACLSTV_04990 [Coriobacteriales bacterium]|nr:MAG: hypothetical protein DBY05_04920 [Clostridiales bacterium]